MTAIAGRSVLGCNYWNRVANIANRSPKHPHSVAGLAYPEEVIEPIDSAARSREQAMH